MTLHERIEAEAHANGPAGDRVRVIARRLLAASPHLRRRILADAEECYEAGGAMQLYFRREAMQLLREIAAMDREREVG